MEEFDLRRLLIAAIAGIAATGGRPLPACCIFVLVLLGWHSYRWPRRRG